MEDDIDISECLSDQKDEIESLESIFMDEFTLIGSSPYSYELKILPEESQELSITSHLILKVKYAETYPHSAPIYEIEGMLPLTKSHIAHLNHLSSEIIESNLGCPLIFSLTSELKEHLTSILSDFSQEAYSKKEAASALEAESNPDSLLNLEREFKKATQIGGEIKNFTAVTKESFKKWVLIFEKEEKEEEEKAHKKLKEKDKEKEKDISKRATGKQFFLSKKAGASVNEQEQEEEELKHQVDREEEADHEHDVDKEKEIEELFYYEKHLYDDIPDFDDDDQYEEVVQ